MNFLVFLGITLIVSKRISSADVQELYNAVAPLQATVKSSANENEPVVITTQFHSQDELGQYTYGYASSDGTAKVEVKDHEGIVAGKYTYIDPNGLPVEVTYTADKDGFHPVANHLPVAPAVPELPEDLKLAYEEANARLAAAYAAAAAAAEQAAVGGGEEGGEGGGGEAAAQETVLIPVTFTKQVQQPKRASKKRLVKKVVKKLPKRHAIFDDGYYYIW